jgi:hypothetical protein
VDPSISYNYVAPVVINYWDVGRRFTAVPTRVASLYKFACHSSHKADRDFQRSTKALRLRYNHFISIRSNKSLMVEL